MRLISQDNTVDMPYTGTTVKITEQDDIWMITAQSSSKVIACMGEYASKANAQAAFTGILEANRRGWKSYHFPNFED